MTSRPHFTIPTNLRIYLGNIADRLSAQHAAVMVGSGFSRNATKHHAQGPEFPDWPQLGDLFAKELYGPNHTSHIRYTSVATLAHEVAAAIGRPALNQMLRDAIPDLEHEPSDLHTDLLSLPWSDVFTTNYDTLLERASRTLTTQRYNPVHKQQDLVFAGRPRIIKLHGSLRSTERLIITDEDYRSYPDKSAPLLNTVRQCLLENTLCLIGFSGTDPNFLQWIGWLHDHLGRFNSPKIYLIGTFDLSTSQIQLLENRNIVVVDMSQCDDIEAGDHYSAVKRFVDYLKMERTAYRQLAWPTGKQTPFPSWDKTTLEELTAKTIEWKSHRNTYPGWVIVPSDRRTIIKRSIDEVLSGWDVPQPLHQSELPLFVDLNFAYELIWRTEKCLYPIFDPQVHFYSSVLTRYWDYITPNSPKAIPKQHRNIPDANQLSRSQIRAKCFHLALAMMRYFRQEGIHDKWEVFSNQLNECREMLSPEHRAQYHYELALAALFELNSKKLNESIKEWRSNESLPFWEAKRASILAEIGKVDEAKKILSDSLRSIRARSNLKSITKDYSLISQEAHVMYLLTRLPVPIWQVGESNDGRSDDDETRWSLFHQYKSDPTKELMLFELILNRPLSNRAEVTERPTFDIGHTNRTYRLLGADSELAAAFNYLCFCEDSGIPLSMSRPTTHGVLSRMSIPAPYWAVVSLLRLGDKEPNVVDSIFGRYSLSRHDSSFIDSLSRRFLEGLNVARSEIASTDDDLIPNFGSRLAQIGPEVLSRLCSKCSPDVRMELLDFLSYAYRADVKNRFAGIRNLTYRLLQALTVQERVDAIPRLLDFPIVSHPSPLVEREYVNPFIFLDLTKKWSQDAPKLPSDKVDVWLASASSPDPHVRQWAVFTLAVLHEWCLLSDHQSKSLGVVLWDQCDEFGWPMHTGLRRYLFLKLPYPEPHNPLDLFKEYVRNAPFPEVANPGTFTMGGDKWTVLHDIQWASQQTSWNEEDGLLILNRCISWWCTNQNFDDLQMTSYATMFGESDFKQTVVNLMDTIAAVVRSSVSLSSHDDVKECIQSLIRDFTAHGLLVNHIACACLRLFPEERDTVLGNLCLSLASSDIASIEDSLRAVRVLLEDVNLPIERDHKQELSKLLLTVGQIIFWRRSIGLPEAIDSVSGTIETCPWIVSDELEHLLLEGLRYIIDETVTHLPSGRLQNLVVDEHDFSNRLVVRRNATRLAFVLHEHYTASEVVVPPIVSKWGAICQSDDEFAEIRNEWRHS